VGTRNPLQNRNLTSHRTFTPVVQRRIPVVPVLDATVFRDGVVAVEIFVVRLLDANREQHLSSHLRPDAAQTDEAR
jgi:hypothetical protein